MFKYSAENLIEWLTRVCNVCLMKGRVLKVWKRAATVPFYKGKGDEM